MREMPLDGGHVALVDDADYEPLSGFSWHVSASRSGKAYVVRNNKKGLHRTTVRMHRQILGITDSAVHIDHRNGDGLDNQRSNLRIANNSENGANRRVVLSRHGFKGIHYIPYTQNKGRRWTRRKPWKATLTRDYKVIHIGYFETAIEAATAYDLAAVQYFGAFAATNADLGLLGAKS